MAVIRTVGLSKRYKDKCGPLHPGKVRPDGPENIL